MSRSTKSLRHKLSIKIAKTGHPGIDSCFPPSFKTCFVYSACDCHGARKKLFKKEEMPGTVHSIARYASPRGGFCRAGGTSQCTVREMLLPGFEGPNLNAWGVEVVRKRKFRQGEKAMTRSAHTFLWKSKRVAGMAIGAIAMLAVAGPALAQATGDEVFQVKTVIQVPGRIITSPFFSFDISWFDPTHKKFFLTDRNSLAIDVVDALNPGAGVTQQFFRPFAGVQASPDTSGPDGVLTANNDTELWIGDSPGKVWVLNSQTGDLIALPGSPTG